MTMKEQEHFISTIAITMSILDDHYGISGANHANQTKIRLGMLQMADSLFDIPFVDIYLANKDEGKELRVSVPFYYDKIEAAWNKKYSSLDND